LQIFDTVGAFVRGEGGNVESGEDARIEYRRQLLAERTSATESHRRTWHTCSFWFHVDFVDGTRNLKYVGEVRWGATWGKGRGTRAKTSGSQWI